MSDALDGAINIFAERGYHATSIGDLTTAMGVAQGSVYKAFKDKKAVFIAALERYKLRQTRRFEDAVGKGVDGRDRVRQALEFYAAMSHGDGGRQGCLLVGASADLGTLDEDVAIVVRQSVDAREKIIARLVREGQSDGSIAASLDPEDLARTTLCFLYGMRLVGKTGKSREEMKAVVDLAMRMLG